MLEYKTKPDDTGVRLDILVTGLYPQFSRSSLEVLFDKDMVRVNGDATRAAYKVKPADKITVDESFLKNSSGPIDLPIIYEDDNVTVIDKPAGILTHSKGALNLEPTVASFIKDKISAGLSGNRAGIVHRLDRDTSGVIITAKNPKSLNHLQTQFSKRNVKKTYVAVVEGTLDPAEAVIDAPIGRNPKKPQTFKVMPSGKPAITKYRTLNEFKTNGRNYTFVELRPETGRTHQLRVHLAYIGHPTAGDPVYGHPSGGLMLHATSLELTLPGGERRTFESPPAGRFKEFGDG